MISKPTVLVLGAGASQPYGYPSGVQLMEEIVNITSNLDHHPGVPHAKIVYDNHSLQDVKQFANDLLLSGRKSVDAFLEHRDDFAKLGKLMIALRLIPRESGTNEMFKKGDWYQYLFGEMVKEGGFDDFGANKVSIVTYNYDRSLEQYLLTALQNSYNRPSQDALAMLEKIPIVHVHGKLGSISNVPYNGHLGHTHEMVEIASQIQIIHESNDDSEELQLARCILDEAEIVCFLGFGFHERNVRRLLKGKSPGWMSKKKVFACGFGITDAEKLQIAYGSFENGSLIWGRSDFGCLEFLRKSGALMPRVNIHAHHQFRDGFLRDFN